jgi:ammonium transporter, Amt family
VTPAHAAAAEISTADTAWMIVATALVLMMTISILWSVFGYSLIRRHRSQPTLLGCSTAIECAPKAALAG